VTTRAGGAGSEGAVAEPGTTPPAGNDWLLNVVELKTHYLVRQGVFRMTGAVVRAVDGVSFTLQRNETLGIVGESGCGKSTVAKTILGIVGRHEARRSGQIWFRHDGSVIEVNTTDVRGLRQVRKQVQMVFQDPESSLNPRLTIRDIIGEPLIVNKVASGREVDRRVIELMRAVGLDPAYLRRYPYAFSGGQRQRIGIARALALGPQLIVADEPTSALDVSVQAQVLNLLKDLQRGALSYIFISHDLSVIEHVSTRVAVMYLGRIVEIGTTAELFRSPRMPYTEALLSAITRLDPGQKMERIIPQGDVADPAQIPSGCPFHPRCRYREDRCTRERPELMPVAGSADHLAACHFADHLALRGVQPSRRRRANTAGG
jgi:peptide/nickel transport system ATP-binding protein